MKKNLDITKPLYIEQILTVRGSSLNQSSTVLGLLVNITYSTKKYSKVEKIKLKSFAHFRPKNARRRIEELESVGK